MKESMSSAASSDSSYGEAEAAEEGTTDIDTGGVNRRQVLQTAMAGTLGLGAAQRASAHDGQHGTTYNGDDLVIPYWATDEIAGPSDPDGEMMYQLDQLEDSVDDKAMWFALGDRAPLYVGNAEKYRPWIADHSFDPRIVDYIDDKPEHFKEETGGFAYTLNMVLNEEVPIKVVGLDTGELDHDYVHSATGVIEEVADDCIPGNYDVTVEQDVVEPDQKARQAMENMLGNQTGYGANKLRKELDIAPKTAPVYVTSRSLGTGVAGFAEMIESGASVLTTADIENIDSQEKRDEVFENAAAMEWLHAVGQLPHSCYEDGAMSYNDAAVGDWLVHERSQKMLNRVMDGQLVPETDTTIGFETGSIDDPEWVRDDFEDHVRTYLRTMEGFEDLPNWDTWVNDTIDADDDYATYDTFDVIQFYQSVDDFDFTITGTVDGYFDRFDAIGEPKGGSFPDSAKDSL